MLTQRPAFATINRQTFLREIGHAEPPRPRSINRSIPVDLENVVLKATAKEPGARYATAADFAADLNRFLQGKPTLAKRPKAFDRVAKWTRRHSKLVAASLLLLLVLLAGTATALVKIATAQRATLVALDEAKVAKRDLAQQLERAREAFDGLLQLNEQLKWLPGTETHRQDVLEQALSFLSEQASATDSGNPASALGVAVASMKVGDIYRQLGDQNQALGYFDQSVDLLDRLLDGQASDPELRGHAARARNNRGLLLTEMGQLERARTDLDAAVSVHSSLAKLPADERGTTVLDDLSSAFINRGRMHLLRQQSEEARRDLMSATRIVKELLEGDATSARFKLRLASLYQSLGAFAESDRPQVAQEYWLKALDLNSKLVAEEPGNLRAQQMLATTENSFGRFLRSHGEPLAVDSCTRPRCGEIKSWLASRLKLSRIVLISERPTRCSRMCSENWTTLKRLSDTMGWPRQSSPGCVKRMPNSAVAHSNLGATLFNRGLLRAATDSAEGEALCAEGIEHQDLATKLAPQLDNFQEFLEHQRNEFRRKFAES